ncbi:hypothetical protein OQN96_001854, partial [Campylobacter coli]|nr:hypothetical protein [Campylobacter coli]
DFIFFYHQILKQKDLNFLLGVRNKIALKVHNYMQEYSTSPKDLISNIHEYFGCHFINSDFNNLQNFQKNDFFTLPEKCLQYFHLAMIHLCFMVLNPLNFKDSNRHLDKAINYLIDGTFEIYELIFKEYFLLFPKDEELKDELKKIKNLEFKILMQEVSRVKLLNHYK